MSKTRTYVGIVAYLVADLSPGLQGLGGAFVALFCDPTLSNESVPDLGHSSVVEVLWGVSVTRSPSTQPCGVSLGMGPLPRLAT
jgi:hypothetical protein